MYDFINVYFTVQILNEVLLVSCPLLLLSDVYVPLKFRFTTYHVSPQ